MVLKMVGPFEWGDTDVAAFAAADGCLRRFFGARLLESRSSIDAPGFNVRLRLEPEGVEFCTSVTGYEMARTVMLDMLPVLGRKIEQQRCLLVGSF